MALIECQNCGWNVSSQSNICPRCERSPTTNLGDVEVALVTCPEPECGWKVSTLARACPQCGCPVNESDKNVETDTKEANRISNYIVECGKNVEDRTRSELVIDPNTFVVSRGSHVLFNARMRDMKFCDLRLIRETSGSVRSFKNLMSIDCDGENICRLWFHNKNELLEVETVLNNIGAVTVHKQHPL